MKRETGENYDFDEKSGHLIMKGSLRPDGTRRKDRIIKISSAIEAKFPAGGKYVAPALRDAKYEEMLKNMNDLKITIVNDQCQRRERIKSFLDNELGEYKCICQREEKILVCANCGHTVKGRILKVCRKHPLDFKSTDFSYCPECHSHQLYLIEKDKDEKIKKETISTQKNIAHTSPENNPKICKDENNNEKKLSNEDKPMKICKDENNPNSISSKEVKPWRLLKFNEKLEIMAAEKVENGPLKKPNSLKNSPKICEDENNNKAIPSQEDKPALKKVIVPKNDPKICKDEKNNNAILSQEAVKLRTKILCDKCTICRLLKFNENLDKLAKERMENESKELENSKKRTPIPPEIDARVESWFAKRPFAYKPLNYNSVERMNHPYKPAKYEGCVCNRNPSLVVCGFCGFGQNKARIKITCNIHPDFVNENDISLCPGCKKPGFLTELIHQE